MLSLPNNRASYLINEGKSVQKLMHRTISNSTYLFNIQSGFYNIHSTSIQTTDPPASVGNHTGKVKKKKKNRRKKRLGQRYLPGLLLSQSLHIHFNLQMSIWWIFFPLSF